MPRHKPTYKQLPLPYDETDLTRRVRMVLPAGLRELADDKQLSDDQVRQLAGVWSTIRGRRPTTAAEWIPVYEAMLGIWEEEAREQ